MKIKNIEPRMVTYFHTKGRKLGLPIAGSFELTARCNFNCPMCYVHQSADEVEAMGGELTAQQWLDLAAAAQKQGMIFALLTGGEPLLRKDFFEIYNGMKKLGLMISINSNGSLLKGEILERFLQDPPLRFNISLYGGSNGTYQKMCGIPAYEQVKENIRALRQAGVAVSLNLSITPWNCEDLERIYADAMELDVNVKASSYMYPPIRLDEGNAGCGNRLCAQDAALYSVLWDKIRFTPEEFAARAQGMADAVQEGGCPVEADEGVRCRAGSTSFWVTWQGDMMPCGMMNSPVVKPLEIGFDAAWEQIKARTREIRSPKACGECSWRDVCGVCAAVCQTETGKFDAVPEYICQKTREQVRLAREMSRMGDNHED